MIFSYLQFFIMNIMILILITLSLKKLGKTIDVNIFYLHKTTLDG